MPRRGLLLPGLLLFALTAVVPPVAAQTSPSPFDETDVDKNGRIDRPEYQRRMVEVFYFADADKNGYVTIAELNTSGPVDTGAFRAADRDGDGRLSMSEFVTYRMIQFDEADTNRDGVLTREEVAAWHSR